MLFSFFNNNFDAAIKSLWDINGEHGARFQISLNVISFFLNFSFSYLKTSSIVDLSSEIFFGLNEN